ncbi:MAG: hypothetical protein RIR94_1582 [Bacteroidota bacterium]
MLLLVFEALFKHCNKIKKAASHEMRLFFVCRILSDLELEGIMILYPVAHYFLPKRLRKMRTNGKAFSKKRWSLDFFFLAVSKYSESP